ncbi:MAG TPA: DUF3800 domain-containing protein, partial [Bacillota bacterium]|nr:DUF3800 domain-containing protein [Bacillota bacterium]
MEKLYVDESGSMTYKYRNHHNFFVVCIIRAIKPDIIKKNYKRFVSKNFEKLKSLDNDKKMFLNGKFKELKGNMFTPQLKREFADYICRNSSLEIFYILIDNTKVDESLYSNTARAFNYVLKLALINFINCKLIANDALLIQLDERNERPDSVRFLEDYLNTELQLTGLISGDVKIKYFDSCNNQIVQIADVF